MLLRPCSSLTPNLQGLPSNLRIKFSPLSRLQVPTFYVCNTYLSKPDSNHRSKRGP